MTSNDEYVLTLLREKGFVTAEQLEAASQAMREGNETTLDVLLASGAVTENDVPLFESAAGSPETWFYDPSWNCLRVTVRGVDVSGEFLSFEASEKGCALSVR